MKIIYKILLVLIISIGTVATLYCMQEKPKLNGFNRGLIYTAKKLDSLELKYNYWHINRLSDNRIYLGNYKALLVMFSCSYNMQDSVYERLLYIDERKPALELLKQLVLQQIDTAKNSFNTDGYLSYNTFLNRMIYTYYYRNEFVCLDSRMNILYTGKTIDTNTVAKIQLGEYRSGDKKIRAMAKPGLVVNKRGYADEFWFYNHAALAADNEQPDVFKKYEVLDVYQLDNGRYSHSIYLPKHKGEKLTDFAVRGNLIVALYGKYLISYEQRL
jgi:hypothetical protein